MAGQLVVLITLTSLVMVTPGPDMMLVLRNTLLGGRRAGLSTSGGVLAGNLVHITYCLLGIGLLIAKSILAFAALKYAAAVYLISLGVQSLRTANQAPAVAALDRCSRARHWFLQGFISNVLNPKGTLFYLGVFTVVIVPGTAAGAMLVLVCGMMLVSASFWLLFVFTLDRPAIHRWIARSQRTVHRVSGGLMILLGVRVAFAER